jgi:hypothetical protein
MCKHAGHVYDQHGPTMQHTAAAGSHKAETYFKSSPSCKLYVASSHWAYKALFVRVHFENYNQIHNGGSYMQQGAWGGMPFLSGSTACCLPAASPAAASLSQHTSPTTHIRTCSFYDPAAAVYCTIHHVCHCCAVHAGTCWLTNVSKTCTSMQGTTATQHVPTCTAHTGSRVAEAENIL